MKYPGSLLFEDERVVFDVHHHRWSVAGPALLLFLAAASWVILLFALGTMKWLVAAGLAAVGCAALYLVWRLAEWSRTNLVLTDVRLIHRSGVFTRHTSEMPLSSIRDVTFYQMVWGRILGMGDLVVQGGEGAGKHAYFDLPHPDKLRLSIMEQAHLAGTAPAAADSDGLARSIAREMNRTQPTVEMPALPPERPPLYSEIVDQIERLDAMRDRGVLSDAEFERAKQGLIDRLGEEVTG